MHFTPNDWWEQSQGMKRNQDLGEKATCKAREVMLRIQEVRSDGDQMSHKARNQEFQEVLSYLIRTRDTLLVRQFRLEGIHKVKTCPVFIWHDFFCLGIDPAAKRHPERRCVCSWLSSHRGEGLGDMGLWHQIQVKQIIYPTWISSSSRTLQSLTVTSASLTGIGIMLRLTQIFAVCVHHISSPKQCWETCPVVSAAGGRPAHNVGASSRAESEVSFENLKAGFGLWP